MSALLWLRFALIRKFSVSRDNAPPLNHDFAATRAPGPKVAASGPGAGRTWGSGLPKCEECAGGALRLLTSALMPHWTDVCRGEGEREGGSCSGDDRQTWENPRPPLTCCSPTARLAHKGTCTSKCHFRNQRRCSRPSLETQRPAMGPDNIPDINNSVVQGAVSVTMRTRAFHEHFLRPSAGPRA